MITVKETNKPRKLLIFDMDGTLYSFKNGSYDSSGLHNKVISNAVKFIQQKFNKTEKEAEELLLFISSKYGEHISVGLEKEFGIDRFDYFNFVWNINPKGIVKPSPQLKNLLENLAQNNFLLVIASSAPRIWIDNVLQYLHIADLFGKNIFSGETDFRKSNSNVFDKLLEIFKYTPEDTTVIGDQEDTDIIPAKKLGISTAYINSEENSKIADYTIKSILDLEKLLLS